MERKKRTTIMLSEDTLKRMKDIKKFIFFSERVYLKTYEDLIIYLIENYIWREKNEGNTAKDERKEG